MKIKALLLASVLGLSLLQTSYVFAEGPKDLINNVNNFEKREEATVKNQQQKQQNNLDQVKRRVDKEIARRIDRLNKLLQRIQNDQKLTSDEKSNLSADIQSDITGLTNLKSKVDSDTDMATLRSDAKQVVTKFRVFEIAVPKTRLLIIIDNLQSVVTRISGFTPKIQDLINNLKSQGKDVTQLQSSLDDINGKLTALNDKLSSDKSIVLGVTLSTSDPKSIFTQVRKDLADVRHTLGEIRHDFGQMRETFRIIITGGNSGNGSASVSPTPSVSPSPTPTASPSV